MTHMIFPGGSITPGSHRPNVWSIIVSARPKIDSKLYKFILRQCLAVRHRMASFWG